MKTRKMMLFAAMLAIAAMTACSPKTEELVVGKWAVSSIHTVGDDHTAGEHFDYTESPTDDYYIGYDTVVFNADGTTRWHMNDRYVRGGMFSSDYRDFNWYVTGDSLIVWVEFEANRCFAFEIKELDRSKLVAEQYSNTPEEYSHHHIEQTQCYTFSRAD